MGLKSAIQAAAKTAKTATADLWTSIVFKSVAPASYDTATGAVTSLSSSTTVQTLLDRYSEKQVDGVHIMTSDIKVTILQADLSDTPDVNDIITIDSKDWGIVSIKQDAANATWEIQARVNS